MRVELGAFTSGCVETTFGPDLSQGLRSAARHYSRRLRSATRPAALPPIGAGAAVDAPKVELDVELEPRCALLLEREARSQGVDLQQLLVHAVFVCAADLDRAR
jgi:hypothetical protein